MATQREVAEHLFLEASGRQVRNWHKQPGFPVPIGKGGYDLVSVRKWYIAFLKSRHLKNGADQEGDIGSEMDELKRDLVKENVRTKKIKNDRDEGVNIPVEAARHLLAGVMSRVNANFKSLTPIIKRNNPDISYRVIESIDKEVIKVQNETSKIGDRLDEIIDELVDTSDQDS
jgi:phage terminase Nu1 subunit (DNA packaging protein)